MHISEVDVPVTGRRTYTRAGAATRKVRNVNQNLNAGSGLAPEIREDLLDEVAAGRKGPGADAVTPPDPFRKNSSRSRKASGPDAVTPPDPF